MRLRCLPLPLPLLPLLLALPGAWEEPFPVSIRPEASMVAPGGSVWLNCSTTCQDPAVQGSLETSLPTAREERGPGWEAKELVNIRQWVSVPQCYFFCYGNISRASARITTYRAPEQVVLEPLPALVLGQTHTLTCRVWGVAPVRHLTVSLRQGNQTLHTETFHNRTGAGPDNVTVTHEITPQRWDHGQQVTCLTALDLTPHGPLIRNSSAAAELRVHGLLAAPQLQASPYIEVGTTMTIHCSVAGVVPCAAEARISLSFGVKQLNSTLSASGDTATAQAEVRSLSLGEHQLSCRVSVGPVSRATAQSVHVYSFPPPVLEIDQPQALVDTNVSLTCRSPATQPPGITLQLRDAERALAAGQQPLLQLALPARKADNGRQFTCEGNLSLGSHSLVKTTSARLSVLYKPTLAESGCPTQQTWLEGTLQQLVCEADGNPPARVSCSKDGRGYEAGTPQRVTRGHAGVYLCRATNAHGTGSRNVTVRVEYKPALDESSCPSTWTWVKGMPQTFTCRASGVPAPEVVCVKDGGLYHLGQGLGLTDPTGIYQCNATNPHGSATKTVTISLEYKPDLSEAGCPSNQTWLEGTLRTLACEADGIPVPHVPCTKEGAAQAFAGERNVSRNDSGTYWCTASNSHGSARRAVTVRVEYRPVITFLAVSPSAAVAHRTNFSVSCRAEGSPAPAYRWALPSAPNVHYSADNSTVTVSGAGQHNSGVYKCVASNTHGQHLAQVRVQVTDNSLVVGTVTAVAAMVLLGSTAGLVYYLKSTACKKGEYNVQDAESACKAGSLAPPHDGIYGIQLAQT
ncbi:intercellular adhesion molecule 5-like [Carettochelys insculpta]|uniref:intercellular adhesion molecule 5-like n=1 Tax=Carettochelys insculpta TaxID=44489 RepID=UPI003EBEBFE5